jgi:hypothetical protein
VPTDKTQSQPADRQSTTHSSDAHLAAAAEAAYILDAVRR